MIFRTADLKVERADQHIQELAREVGVFIDSYNWDLSIEVDEYVRRESLVFSIDPPPEMLSPIIGDAIHNSRAALDLMWWELVHLVGGRGTKWTRFPIVEDRDEAVRKLAEGPIQAADQSIIDFITDTVMPYRTGNQALCAIHDLDIIDKHTSIIPITSVASLGDIVCRNKDGVALFSVINGARLELQMEGVTKLQIFKMPLGAGIKLTHEGNPTIDVVFGQGQPFAGEPIVPTLASLNNLVASLIQDFKEAFLATR